MTLIEIFILAVIQGLTEWLPVSSSGHLVITQKILGLNLPLVYSVMLHVGTLFVVIIFFWKDILCIIEALIKREFETEEGKLATFIVIGSIPIAIIGLVSHDIVERLFSDLFAVSIALIITAVVIFFSEKRKGNRKMKLLDSLLIGLAQGIALIPGISRSGMTISMGLLRQIEKKTVFKYSFLLSVPAIIGATIMESKDIVTGNIEMAPIFFGVITSMIVGYFSLKILQKIVISEKFHLFGYYCGVVGIVIILLSFFH